MTQSPFTFLLSNDALRGVATQRGTMTQRATYRVNRNVGGGEWHLVFESGDRYAREQGKAREKMNKRRLVGRSDNGRVPDTKRAEGGRY